MTISIRKIIVPEEHRFIPSGQAVRIIAQIVESNLTDVLINPNNAPLLTLYNPLNIKLINEQPLTLIQTGHYGTEYQTKPSDIKGDYKGTIIVENNGVFARVEKSVLFRVVRASDFVIVTYLVIKDQSGKSWYWYIDELEQIIVSGTIPDFISAIPEALPTVIYWFTVLNGNNALRYVYPDTLGQPSVSNIQPGVGTGVTGSPEFTGLNGNSYLIDLDTLDQFEVIQI